VIKENLIILIDGSSYLYRAFHALPSLTNTQGEPTGAIYGMISMLKKLMADYHPEYIAVVFDPKGKTKRDTIYSEYKANRTSMPSELSVQIKYIFEMITAMGLPVLVEEGIEADDVIGTLAAQATALGLSTLISTGDKDMAQLVNDNVTLINTMTNVIYDKEGVIKKFGVPPEQIIDYLALIGDKVDNIPGIPNVGPKTACKWLADFGSLEAIIKNADKIKGKVGESLRHHLDYLPLSKQLVTIDTNVRLAEKVIDLKKREPNKPALIHLYRHLEFKTWLSELLEKEINSDFKKYTVIYDKKELSAFIASLKNCKCYALDIEASHLDAMRADLIGMAFATEPQKAVYIPLAHHYESAPKQLDMNIVLKQLKPILLDTRKILVGENLKFALNLLLRYGIEVKNKLYDTMLESYIQNTSQAKHDKTTLSLKYLGRRALSYEDIGGKGAKQVVCSMLDIEKVSQYAAGGAGVALELHQVMWENISKDTHLTNIINEIEMPLTSVLASMEYQGVLIDASMLKAQSQELATKIKTLEEEAYNYVGHSFNLNSPKQLQTILYDKLQLPILSKTPTGQPSTSEAILQRLSHDFPLPKIILEHRSLSKIKTTYTDSLPLQVNSRTGRIHTCYNQAVTLTGRLSSTDPNLQNIPARNEEGRRIRQAFIAPPGYRMVSADYSQVELRIMAHLSKDPGLLNAFEQKLDIHKATAAEVFNIPLDKVTSYQRRSAKAINFGLIYGMSSFGLAEQLNIERSLAQRYIDLYFKRYPNILAYMESTRLLAHKQGYVQTVKGRKIYLPEINASNIQRQRAAERAAINAPLQGTAAEIIKMAMIKIDEYLRTSHSKAKMIMQVHDELVFEVPEEDLENTKKQIKKIMVNVLPMDVPLAVDIGVGKNWGEAH
jgi:DNA polymerase-1